LKRRPRKNSPQTRNRQRTTSKSKPQAEIIIHISLPSRKLAETVYNSLLPETRQTPGFRSQTIVDRKDHILQLNIRADDIVALRAASNTFLRFVSVAMKTLNVVAPFYRADNPNRDQQTTGKTD
jgi:tRNA threonylcarbamoyladenosine modification (KEOPS) complex  Pcc1 subunit